MNEKTINIGDRVVGPGQPVFIIAEAGVNHDGDMEMAKALVDAAADAGADAVKFQTFNARALASIDAPKADYQLAGAGRDESQYAMLLRLEIDADGHRIIEAHCKSRNIVFLSSPFCQDSADLLARMDMPAFKIPSGEIINPLLLRHIADLGKPVILSTGMARMHEVKTALHWLEEAGAKDIILLQCTSNYPADPANCNLRAMQTMAETLKKSVGFSDHSVGNEIALAAVALGACVIEKHLTLDRTGTGGPDHAASSEPEEFAQLVEGIRKVETALGHGRKEPTASEALVAAVARRSIVAAVAIPAGTEITASMLAVRRPGTGIDPTKIDDVVGRQAKSDIADGTQIDLGMMV